MKKLKQIILSLSILLTAIPALAETISDEDMDEIPVSPDTDPGNIGTSDPSKRPKSVNRQQIDCHYTNGTLFIQFAISEGNCELTVIDGETGELYIYNFDSSTSSFINISRLKS
ncbi:MAG: hypothetical protein K2K27_01460, partial [Muribaculaceae bacterium]|nr:hypothetical protein [Muribaculaceae bacterium]